RNAWRHLGRVHSQNVSRGPVQSDMAEIAGLMNAGIIVEVQADIVGGVITLRLDLLVGDEGDIGIGRAKQRDELLTHRAGEPAPVPLLELHQIGNPAERVAEGTDRYLDEHLLASRGIVMAEYGPPFLSDFEAETNEITLSAVHSSGFGL